MCSASGFRWSTRANPMRVGQRKATGPTRSAELPNRKKCIMHKSIKFLGMLAVAGLIAAGGSAYTASNTGAAGMAHVGGYSSATVTGAAVSDIAYTYSADRATVNKVTFTLSADLAGGNQIAEAQLGDSTSTWQPCVYTAASETTIVCTWSPGSPTADNSHLTLVVRDGDTHLTSSSGS